ncbi:phage shock protein C [Paenibacillus sp. PastF-1]|nr:phage shock protein C [Paenibacillus sp. PastF-2]MDF9850886.1 phage shock protein C [Paenibacillus sp. PastM-2]MDF9857500.1 phage shock protein C [Paenibacillus sp. PastF-1]MDH6482724.1 phage shock protein C [Paenibacillus sp. PastH-2]MDH6510150.1 phage shock protein C [Paenibacillus sp. PastM-3]
MAERSSAMTRLYRSTRDKVMTGLAGGLSETLGIDSTLFRILLLVSIPFTGGATILVYFIAALIIPKEPTQYNPFGPGPGAPGGPYGGHYGGPGYGSGPQGPHAQGGYGGPGGQPGYNPNPGYNKANSYPGQDSGLDAMMKDIEKKALQKEVEELKQKLAKYEKGEV